jgi:hypothetical protein
LLSQAVGVKSAEIKDAYDLVMHYYSKREQLRDVSALDFLTFSDEKG